MKKISKYFVAALLLALTNSAIAQGLNLGSGDDAVTNVEAKLGLPTGFIITAIGVLSGYLVGPLTAIGKKLGKTSGPTTVAISAVLSFLIVAVGGWYVGLYPNFQTALYSALVATLWSNGQYLMRIQSINKGRSDSANEPNTNASNAPTEGQSIGQSFFNSKSLTMTQVTNPAYIPGYEFQPSSETQQTEEVKNDIRSID